MKTKKHSQQFLKKRKFFMVLPLLVLPFLTVIFWALGGGKASDVEGQQQSANGRLNVKLPDAYFKEDKALNKLSYYELADSDSAKLERINNGEQYNVLHNSQLNPSGTDSIRSLSKFPSSYNNNSRTYSDPNEAKVYRKIEDLNAALQKETQQNTELPSRLLRNANASVNSDDMNRLEQMVEMVNGANVGEDPEINQLNGMMDKILNIQHPERLREQIKQKSEINRGKVYAVTTNSQKDYVSLLSKDEITSGNHDTVRDRKLLSNNGFYSLNTYPASNTTQQNTIQAVIHETQSLVDGSIVKLRLLNDIFINGSEVPKGIFLFGTASLNGERLNIQINSIRYQNLLYPVQLSVFDMDGINGIHIPGAITRDVAKASTDQAIQGINFNDINPSLSAQAAGAGIEAAKTLLSKKAKLVRVFVKAGYQVLLQDGKQNTSF